MALLDAGNSLLANQSLNSGNGDSYPQADAVPEPVARRKVRN